MKVTTFSERLKYAMTIRNIKAAEICATTGIPKSSMSFYISGHAQPKPERVQLLAKYLNISEAWLMGYDASLEQPDNVDENYAILSLIERLGKDSEFLHMLIQINNLTPTQIKAIQAILCAFTAQ